MQTNTVGNELREWAMFIIKEFPPTHIHTHTTHTHTDVCRHIYTNAMIIAQAHTKPKLLIFTGNKKENVLSALFQPI